MEDKTGHRRHFQKRSVLVFSPCISEEGFTLEIRTQFTLYYSLICGVHLAGLCYPHKCGSSSEGLCPWGALPQENHQGEQGAHLTSLDCSKKGRGISAVLHQVQLVAWAVRVLPSQVQGEEAGLLLKLFVPTSGFSPFLLGDGGK